MTALLGKGGMGEVYEAYDKEKGRTIALKILLDQYAEDERFRARFLRESRAAAVLQEPHVVPIHDWGEIDGKLFIDMRLVQGQTLHDMLSNGPLEPERAVSIIQQIADALDAAHAERLIHRDVKPQNIIVTPADFAYLVDFGIAETQGDTRLTMAGTQIGSFAYMAPERFDDEPCGPAADIYSLACVLYESLTGDTPFATNSYERLIASHISAPPPRASAVNPRLPASVDEVIARGMAKEPDDRYGSAGALGRAAQRALRLGASASVSNAETRERPHTSSAGGADSSSDAAHTGPFTGPTVVLNPQDSDGRSRQLLLPLAVVGLVVALLLGAIGVVIGLLVSKNSGTTTTAAPTAAPTTGVTVPGPTVYQTVPAPTSSASPPPRSANTAAPDPEAASLEQLRQIAAGDHASILANANDQWVPQLSSKRPGVFDQGVVWDNVRTLQEHLRLRQQYGAKLLWSGDWSTFSDGDWWVTIAPLLFTDSSGALQWCREQGYDRNHCFAKLISTTHGVAGSTAYN
nr:serine/threonine-protein kinase [Mycobacterium sp. OAS707]